MAGEVVGTPIDVGLGTVLEERPWKNCSAFPEGQLWLNPVTARSLKPVRLSQGGATGELGGHSCNTFLLNLVQCPLDISTLDKAAALAIATAARVTDLRHYINSDLGYSDRKFSALFTK